MFTTTIQFDLGKVTRRTIYTLPVRDDVTHATPRTIAPGQRKPHRPKEPTMSLPHNLKIGDQRQTRDGNTATLVAYLPMGGYHSRLLWTLREELHYTTSERGVLCAYSESKHDIPSLSAKTTSPQVGMTVRNLTPGNRVGVIVALIPNLRVRYEVCEAGQEWTDEAEVKWPWEDKWQLVSRDLRVAK